MKAIVFVACLLAVACAYDPEKVKTFYEQYEKCLEQLGLPSGQTDAKALMCVGQKNSLYDENNKPIKEKCIEYINALVHDVNKAKAKEIVSKCIDEGQKSSGSNYDKTIAGIECAIKNDLLSLIQKPE